MNKNVFAIAVAGILLVGCKSTKKLNPNDIATKKPIAATLNLTEVADDKVPVTIDPGYFTSQKVIYRLPRVVQGTYSVSDFGKYVDDFKAFDYKGKELPIKKIDTNTWEINNAVNLDKVQYWVNDTFDMEVTGGIGGDVPFSPSGTNIEETNYVLNLHGFIGYFDSLKNSQYTLDVIAPATVKRTSALQEIAATKSKDGKVITSSYFAPRYFDITDNPMFYGELDVAEFSVGDIKIVLSVYSPNKKHNAKQIKAVMEKMMQAQKTYLGDINSTARYDIYLYLADQKETAPKGFGALEHHTSTVVVLPEAMPDKMLAKSMIDVVSHEFFHIVTPLNVHSEDVHYFDYNKPTFSKHLWMYEGITEYFATLFQIHQDLVKEEEFYNKIMGKIKASLSMDDTMSFTKMSENVLENPYAPQYYNVYQKGALIGMCIDILLREESNGNRGVLSLMKELSNKYGKNKPFHDDALIEEITAMTYPSIGTFLKTHVVGTTPIDYGKFFTKVGLKYTTSMVKTNYLQDDGVFLVDRDKETGAIKFTGGVHNNSFWEDNGAKEGDVIKEIDGEVLTPENVNEVLGKVFTWKPGREVEVKLDRKGKEIVIKTVLTVTYAKKTNLTEDPVASQKQKDLRKVWMKG
ncbi:Probable lipoprotein precursor. Peptidase M61 domain protein [Tenacibaculum maritimum]|uniref:M61 family metallopeptidase n=1 Tax=Tenacibaculum maritimum TaxID=107401 RepID=UPI0012E6E8C5|nr:peptidase M61 [Tenacibaculum maritimum]CAA0143870.1 Probable lipoprotein precursor. Peptidase M61 domain protein [Tenacibaculum maritimum]CAA0144464.1 Probable lipoprotein precursor. Peptidase M61 domain protein [Tenacibaculum maritimum]CAA0203781.1 Probable lipoprotein precursor. Peptidase M61 domain protein [Tenacibaculum maritimum]